MEMDERSGRFQRLTLDPKRIYGLGLTYASHIAETGARFDAGEPPPVFKKPLRALDQAGSPVRMPSRDDLLETLDRLEPGLGEEASRRFPGLPALLDYEAELAFVLLEDVDWEKIDDPGYAPRLGFFIANDLSARSIAVLGEGRPDREEYWAESKGFPGFLPVSAGAWVPDKPALDSIPCVELVTEVNGEVRQRETGANLLYTPRQMLKFIAGRFPDDLPQAGDVVLTGTPGGVALRVPAWKARAADLLRLDRFTRLSSIIGSAERSGRFLRPGEEVTVSGGPLGSVSVRIVD